MSTEPTLLEVRKMLKKMLRDSRPKPALNKAKEKEEILDHIYRSIMDDLARWPSQFPLEVKDAQSMIQAVLEQFQFEGVIQNYMVTDMGSNVALVKLNFPFDFSNQEMYIQF